MFPLLEIHHWPTLAWLKHLLAADGVLLEACEHYQKGSFRNRQHIAGPNGLQRLSVPLAHGKNQQMPIREVRIAYDEAWQRLHWRTITAAYGSAPYFEHFADEIAQLYTRRYTFLFDFNMDILYFILKKIKYNGAVTFSDHYRLPFAGDVRNTITPKHIIPDTRKYPQVFEDKFGFIPGLSALDWMMCDFSPGNLSATHLS